MLKYMQRIRKPLVFYGKSHNYQRFGQKAPML